jgi:hypothetical protein
MREAHIARLRYPNPTEIENAMAEARRLRAEAIHGYVNSLRRWVVRLFDRLGAARKSHNDRVTVQGC